MAPPRWCVDTRKSAKRCTDRSAVAARDFGYLGIELTINDTKMYPLPFTIKYTEVFQPDIHIQQAVSQEREPASPSNGAVPRPPMPRSPQDWIHSTF